MDKLKSEWIHENKNISHGTSRIKLKLQWPLFVNINTRLKIIWKVDYIVKHFDVVDWIARETSLYVLLDENK